MQPGLAKAPMLACPCRTPWALEESTLTDVHNDADALTGGTIVKLVCAVAVPPLSELKASCSVSDPEGGAALKLRQSPVPSSCPDITTWLEPSDDKSETVIWPGPDTL